jgi:hypothetical protein
LNPEFRNCRIKLSSAIVLASSIMNVPFERVVQQFLRLKLKQPVTTVESHHVELVKKECFGLFDPLINALG